MNERRRDTQPLTAEAARNKSLRKLGQARAADGIGWIGKAIQIYAEGISLAKEALRLQALEDKQRNQR